MHLSRSPIFCRYVHLLEAEISYKDAKYFYSAPQYDSTTRDLQHWRIWAPPDLSASWHHALAKLTRHSFTVRLRATQNVPLEPPQVVLFRVDFSWQCAWDIRLSVGDMSARRVSVPIGDNRYAHSPRGTCEVDGYSRSMFNSAQARSRIPQACSLSPSHRRTPPPSPNRLVFVYFSVDMPDFFNVWDLVTSILSLAVTFLIGYAYHQLPSKKMDVLFALLDKTHSFFMLCVEQGLLDEISASSFEDELTTWVATHITPFGGVEANGGKQVTHSLEQCQHDGDSGQDVDPRRVEHAQGPHPKNQRNML